MVLQRYNSGPKSAKRIYRGAREQGGQQQQQQRTCPKLLTDPITVVGRARVTAPNPVPTLGVNVNPDLDPKLNRNPNLNLNPDPKLMLKPQILALNRAGQKP